MGAHTMSIVCGEFSHKLLEMPSLRSFNNAKVSEATIVNINRISGLADITLINPCDGILIENIPFFYHCQFSSGSDEALKFGHTAFSDGDTVIVLTIPATQETPAATYIVGHSNIYNIRVCNPERIVIRVDIVADDFELDASVLVIYDPGAQDIFNLDDGSHYEGISNPETFVYPTFPLVTKGVGADTDINTWLTLNFATTSLACVPGSWPTGAVDASQHEFWPWSESVVDIPAVQWSSTPLDAGNIVVDTSGDRIWNTVTTLSEYVPESTPWLEPPYRYVLLHGSPVGGTAVVDNAPADPSWPAIRSYTYTGEVTYEPSNVLPRADGRTYDEYLRTYTRSDSFAHTGVHVWCSMRTDWDYLNNVWKDWELWNPLYVMIAGIAGVSNPDAGTFPVEYVAGVGWGAYCSATWFYAPTSVGEIHAIHPDLLETTYNKVKEDVCPYHYGTVDFFLVDEPSVVDGVFNVRYIDRIESNYYSPGQIHTGFEIVNGEFYLTYDLEDAESSYDVVARHYLTPPWSDTHQCYFSVGEHRQEHIKERSTADTTGAFYTKDISFDGYYKKLTLRSCALWIGEQQAYGTVAGLHFTNTRHTHWDGVSYATRTQTSDVISLDTYISGAASAIADYADAGLTVPSGVRFSHFQESTAFNSAVQVAIQAAASYVADNAPMQYVESDYNAFFENLAMNLVIYGVKKIIA